MRKIQFLAVLAAVLLLSGCAAVSGSSQGRTDSAAEMGESVDGDAAPGTGEDRAEASEGSGGGEQRNQNAEDDGFDGEEFQTPVQALGDNYEAYSGTWTVGGIAASVISERGGTELKLAVTDGNRVTADLFAQQAVTDRFAEIGDITGTIEKGSFRFAFEDDGWGGSGTLVFEFLPDLIRVEVQDYVMAEENSAGYGFTGTYEFLQERSCTVTDIEGSGPYAEESGPYAEGSGPYAEESAAYTEGSGAREDAGMTDTELREAVLEKYYDYEPEELEAAISARAKYREQCSFYGEVQSYLENEREVRDVAGVVEPLFHTEMKIYSREDFEDCPSLIIHLAKNEIYARRGYIFRDQDLYNYFLVQLWYEPSIAPEDFEDSVFNEYEQENLKFLTSLDK